MTTNAPPMDPQIRACLRYGWTALLVFLLGGLLLEALHGAKAAFYFENRLRRELWTLAHAHGALLAILTLLFAQWAASCIPDTRKLKIASRMMRAGALLVPTGFFLGGIGNSETDPSLLIVLTPIGALMVLHAVAVTTLGAWRLSGPGG